MKTSYSIFLLISGLALASLQNVKSQNFQTVNQNHDTYYKSAYSIWNSQMAEDLMAVRTDSVATLPSGESVLYFYRQMRDTSFTYGECILDMIAPSWLGTHLLIRPDGENLFYTGTGDTISIKTQAGPGDSWIFNRQEEYYYQATLESVVFSPVAGTNDSVKVISLQAFSNSGAPVPDWFNQKKSAFPKTMALLNYIAFIAFQPTQTGLNYLNMNP